MWGQLVSGCLALNRCCLVADRLLLVLLIEPQHVCCSRIAGGNLGVTVCVVARAPVGVACCVCRCVTAAWQRCRKANRHSLRLAEFVFCCKQGWPCSASCLVCYTELACLLELCLTVPPGQGPCLVHIVGVHRAPVQFMSAALYPYTVGALSHCRVWTGWVVGWAVCGFHLSGPTQRIAAGWRRGGAAMHGSPLLHLHWTGCVGCVGC